MAVSRGEYHQAESPADIELVVDAVQMNLHRSLLDTESRCDVSRGDALDRQPSDLCLARRQVSAEVRERESAAEHPGDQASRAIALQRGFSPVHLAHTRDER